MNKIFTLQSSQDPTQLSLMWTSVAKVVISLIASYAVKKGLDGDQVTTQLQAIVDSVMVATPAIYGVWHSMEAGWGFLRKLLPQNTIDTTTQVG